jgi:hypothetical protein
MSSVTNSITRVLDRLRGALGTSEHPDGSNSNFIVDWYNKDVAKIGNGPWCEMTNTWSCWTGGAKEIKKGRAYTVYAATDAHDGVNHSTWHWGTKGMRAGDQVYYDWKHKPGQQNISAVDHTGTVEQILGDGTFYVLEGNTGNKLKRHRRDKTYVVGYARLDWAALGPIIPVPTLPITSHKPTPNPALVKRVQAALEIHQDGHWGGSTDGTATMMRRAARALVGSPNKVKRPYNVKVAQRIIDVKDDGIVGPKTIAGMAEWVKTMQKALGTEVGGHWGPITDNAFLVARKHNLNNF